VHNRAKKRIYSQFSVNESSTEMRQRNAHETYLFPKFAKFNPRRIGKRRAAKWRLFVEKTTKCPCAPDLVSLFDLPSFSIVG
jgi:hypothetical protein